MCQELVTEIGNNGFTLSCITNDSLLMQGIFCHHLDCVQKTRQIFKPTDVYGFGDICSTIRNNNMNFLVSNVKISPYVLRQI